MCSSDLKPQRFMIHATGIEWLQIVGLKQPLEIGSAESKTFALNVRADSASASKGTTSIEFQIVAVDAEGRETPGVFLIHEKATFFNR